MSYKKLFTPASMTAMLMLVLTFSLVHNWGTSLQDLMNAIFALAIYGLLIVSYLLRVAMVFFGVFAVYRILRDHLNGQRYNQAEV